MTTPAPAQTWTQDQREAAWGWDFEPATQPHDQHVRARLMADDEAVESQWVAFAIAADYYAHDYDAARGF